MSRLYVDNAATSYPKPPDVVEAVTRYLRDNGSPAGRGAYRQALEVERELAECRRLLAELFGVPRASSVIFTSNGTDSLNTAILGLCRPGDHVIASTWEHNSVLRPLRMLSDVRGVEVTLLEPEAQGVVSPAAVRAALRPNTRLVCLQHANNVIGTVQPIADVGQVVREHGAFFLVDAAQSAGHLPIDLNAMSIDMLACPGHKGLLGPLGTGVLVLQDRAAEALSPLHYGGTGTHSEDDLQPQQLPEKFESGNLNVPGLVGLRAGLQWRTQQDAEALRTREHDFTHELWTRLSSLPHVTLLGPAPTETPRIGVISLQLADYAPQDAAAILDEHFGIQCRSGLHCAPGVHRSLGTLAAGGTLRLSWGPFLPVDAVDTLVAAFTQLQG